jgi:hypothetical protein
MITELKKRPGPVEPLGGGGVLSKGAASDKLVEMCKEAAVAGFEAPCQRSTDQTVCNICDTEVTTNRGQ